MPAITHSELELFKKKFPIKDAVKPKLINTRENAKVKKIVFIIIELFFLLTSFSKVVPEI